MRFADVLSAFEAFAGVLLSFFDDERCSPEEEDEEDCVDMMLGRAGGRSVGRSVNRWRPGLAGLESGCTKGGQSVGDSESVS